MFTNCILSIFVRKTSFEKVSDARLYKPWAGKQHGTVIQDLACVYTTAKTSRPKVKREQDITIINYQHQCIYRISDRHMGVGMGYV
jgi:hypothetical protein